MSSLRATGGADVDPYLYLDPPVLDASGLLALGQALLDAAPLSGHPSLHGPLRRLRQACDDLQGALRQVREAPPPPPPPRPESRQPADFALDNAWTALYDRLRAYAMLPESEVPKVKRAQELLRLLFPDALGFLRLPYEAEWTESDRRLRSVEKLSLLPDLDAIAGPEFLAEVRRTHEIYSRAIGRRSEAAASSDSERPTSPTARETPRDHGKDKDKDKDKDRDKDKDTRDSGENPALRDLRLHLARCISAYAVKVLALTPDDVKDYQATKRWLAPLSAFQRSESRKHAGQAHAAGQSTAGAGTSGAHSPVGAPVGAPVGTTNSQGHTALRSPSPPSLHDWASNLRANDSSGDNKPVADSSPIRPSGGSGRASAPATPASDSRAGGQSGTYRPVGESGLYRPIKRPGS